VSSAEERFDLKARLLHAFERGDLAFGLPSDDPVLFAETAQEICRERGVSLDSHIDYKVGRVTLRANKGFPLSETPFTPGTNTPQWRANNDQWGQIVGFDRGC
jgi:hypothetical protein